MLLVGDAAGYVDALTGEGIAVAVAGARALVDCLARRPAAGLRARLAAGVAQLPAAHRLAAVGAAAAASSGRRSCRRRRGSRGCSAASVDQLAG